MKDKILKYYRNHKKTVIFALLVVIGVIYYYYNSNKASAVITKYTLGAVEKGTISTSVSASGQISSEDQINLRPLVTANVTKVNVAVGQKVKTGDVLVQLNDKDLLNQVKQTQSTYNIASANLASKIAGLTANDKIVAQNSVNSAKLAYDNSVTNLSIVKQNADQNLLKAQTVLDTAQRQYNDALANQGISGDTSSNSVSKAYNDAKAFLNSTLLDMQSALIAADNILGMDSNPVNPDLKTVLGALDTSSVSDAKLSYTNAKSSLSDYTNTFNSVATSWSQAGIENLLSKQIATLQSLKTLDDDVHTALINSIVGTNVSQTNLDSYRNNLASEVSSMNSDIAGTQTQIQNINNAKLGLSSSGISSNSSVASAQTALTTAQNNLAQAKIDNQNNINNAQQDIANKKLSYETAQAQYNLKVAPPTQTDLITLRAQLSQAQNNYSQALENLKNAQMVSPIDGEVATVNVSVGDQANPNEIAVVVITPQEIANVTLNEVDAANVKPGQKVSMTFNAIDGLDMTGVVAQVDMIGTVSQGVVNYNVKITLDTQDSRVKPQMSVNAIIITNQKLDALMVSNSAVKTDNSGGSYVEIFNDQSSLSQPATDGTVTSTVAPTRKNVQIGLVNDTYTEITNGLNEGDQIVTKTTTTGGTTATRTNTTSGLGIFGGGGGSRIGGGRPGG